MNGERIVFQVLHDGRQSLFPSLRAGTPDGPEMETPNQRADQIPIVAAADNGRRPVSARGLGIADDAVQALMPDGNNALFSPIQAGGNHLLIDYLRADKQGMKQDQAVNQGRKSVCEDRPGKLIDFHGEWICAIASSVNAEVASQISRP